MRERIRKRWLLVLAGLLATILAMPAWAQDDEEDEDEGDPFADIYKKPGTPYVSAMATYAIPTEASDLEDDIDRHYDATFGPFTRSDAEQTWGVNGRLGYRVLERLALETQFEWLSGIDVDSKVGMNALPKKTQVGLYAITGNAKGYLLTGRFQPYGVLGAGWGRSRIDYRGGATDRDDGFVWRIGAGFDVYGKPDVALSVETSYVSPEGGIDNLSYVSISAGLTLRFFPGGY